MISSYIFKLLKQRIRHLNLIDLLKLLQSNQLALPALLASLTASLAYTLPRYLGSFIQWVIQRLTYSVTFHFSDAVFTDFTSWLDKNKQAVKFVQASRVESNTKNGDGYVQNTEGDSPWLFTPGYGAFVLKVKSFPFFMLHRYKEDVKFMGSLMPPDILTLSTFIWNKKKCHKFIMHLSDSRNEVKQPHVYVSDGHYFEKLKPVVSAIHPDYLNPDFIEIEKRVAHFLKSKEEYSRRSMLYRLGILMHSEPGSGKSRFIAYLAKKYNMDVYFLRASDLTRNVIHAFSRIPPRSLILLEDIDLFCLGNRESEKAKKKDSDDEQDNFQTLGDLLNIMDGLLGFTGSVLIATTNKIDELDPALIRPGRIDMVKEVKDLPADLIVRYWGYFFDQPVDGLSSETNLSISRVQNILEAHIDDPNKAKELLGIS